MSELRFLGARRTFTLRLTVALPCGSDDDTDSDRTSGIGLHLTALDVGQVTDHG